MRFLALFTCAIFSWTCFSGVAEDFWEHVLQTTPTWATMLGDRRFDAELSDIRPKAVEEDRQFYQSLKNKLDSQDISHASDSEKMRFQILKTELSRRSNPDPCSFWMWSVDQLQGPQNHLAELPNSHTFRSPADAEHLIQRYEKIKSHFSQHIENLKIGLKKGYVSPRHNVQSVLNQLQYQLEIPIEKSPYFSVFLHLPNAWPKEQCDTLTQRARLTIQDSVYPGLLLYRDFIKKSLLKKSRRQVSIKAIPNGEACYAYLIEQHLGSPRSPKSIHELGLSEVKRIKKEFIKLGRIQLDKNQYLSTREELLSYNEKLVQKAKEVLPRAFGKIPTTPIHVKAIEDFREKEAPAAYYYEAPGSSSTPAYYYLNTYKPNRRPLYNMSALAFHEAIPGHHIQISLANENPSLPMFQKKMGSTAFVEGWALYAESLAGELGLYETPEQKFGALNYELWRALRLVVDTGIHFKNWSRDKAIAYLAKETDLPAIEVTNEIDRYIIWPAQALAYKIGELEIKALRKEAQNKLGTRFKLAAFHDQLLAFGALPLHLARENIEKWVDRQID